MAGPEIGSVCNGREDVLAALKVFDEEDISLLHEEQLLQQELVKIRKSLMFDGLNIRSLSSVEKSEMNDRLSQVFQEMASLAAKKAQVLTNRVASMRNVIEPSVVEDETTSKSLPMPKRIPRIGDHPRRRAQSYHAGERNVCLGVGCISIGIATALRPFGVVRQIKCCASMLHPASCRIKA